MGVSSAFVRLQILIRTAGELQIRQNGIRTEIFGGSHYR